LSVVSREAPLALPHRLLGSPIVSRAITTLAVVSAVLFGFAGVGRAGSSPFSLDGRFLQVAGAMWLHGRNPYDAHAFETVARSMGLPIVGALGFAYPPTVAPLALLLGALPPAYFPLALGALNVGAAIATIAILWRLLPEPYAHRLDVRAVAIVAVMASPFVHHVFWMGQTTLVALAALAGGWYFGVVSRRVGVGGVLLALSTLKPQVVAFPLVWLLLERRWALTLVSCVVACAMGLPAAIASGGIVAMSRDWLHALSRYASGPVQTASFQHVFGVRSLLVLSGLGPSACALALATLALGALTLLWVTRERLGALGVLAVSLALSVLFVYAHDYDLAVLAPLMVFAWIETEDRPVAAFALVLSVAALFVPQRLLRGSGLHGWALHWREVVVLGILSMTALLLPLTPLVTRKKGGRRTASARAAVRVSAE
jgi:hypothetical protein